MLKLTRVRFIKYGILSRKDGCRSRDNHRDKDNEGNFQPEFLYHKADYNSNKRS